MRRTPDAVAVLLGVLLSGGAYVPLDPEEPAARAARIARRSAVGLVLCDAVGAAQLDEALRATAPLGDDAPGPRLIDVATIEPVDEPTTAALVGEAERRRGGHLAYVMYTSGSTGQPRASRSSTETS